MLNPIKPVARALIPKSLRVSRYEKFFLHLKHWQNAHFGKFDSFDEALSYLSSKHIQGLYAVDQERWAEERCHAFFVHDYPILYWLGKIVDHGMRLVDLGGSVGVTYYLLGARVPLPPDFLWQVVELPDVVRFGQRLATERQVSQLEFKDDWHEMDGASIVLCAGALQFMPLTMAQMVLQLVHRPTHLLINRVPLVQAASGYVTLHNTGIAIAPVRIESEAAFLSDLEHCDYELVDRWKCLENSIDLPFHAECRVPSFTGVYLRLRAN